MKKNLFFFLLTCSSFTFSQNTLTQKQLLGYEIGSKFSRHHQIIDFFKTLQNNHPTKIKLEDYGKTYEGRDLMLAYISSEENIKKLNEIKLQNQNAINKSSTNQSPIGIVWLSYNVHGDEPSSSEAAMLTAYELLNSNKKEIADWLQNTLVIIDPCLNPDGRDKYVNWYNNIVGKNENNDPQSREHFEPNPPGRTNHYNFDLNRDWAWQTQIETQQRIKKYIEWMPHVHVDFHEQGYNDSYYFAPAAEPMHHIITPWQKNIQNIIGKNHSKYFDEKGWLYFTKQIFDLFYPSYGDTYPMFNGSIGMTYEQAGKSAGLSIKNSAGEILTLNDRVQHHFTTSLSTIEVASKNNKQIVEEFTKYFKKNREEKVGDYETYIATSNDENKIIAIANLLQANGIEYGKPNATAAQGYNYCSNKTENVSLKKYSISVSTHQTKGSMASVLFEPSSKLNDSATYDITAWSLPYVYGVDAYALKGNFTSVKYNSTTINEVRSNYGLIIPYTSFSASKFLAYLLKNNIKPRVATKPFSIDNKEYKEGTLIVLKNANASVDWLRIVNDGAALFNIQPVTVSSGMVDKGSDFGSADVKIIRQPKVALLTGDDVNASAAGEIWSLFDNQLNYPVSLINSERFSNIDFNKYNVLIIADGYYKFLSEKAGIEKLKDFIKSGGRVIAMQEAVNSIAQSNEFGIKNKSDEEAKDSGYTLLHSYKNREIDYLPSNIPGAIYKVELDNSHPLGFGYDKDYYTLKLDANIYEFLKDGWNVGYLKLSNHVAGFRGFKVGNKLKDGTLFGNIEMGNGQLIFLADNPLFRLFWENGKQLFCNAVFMPQ